MKLCWTLNFSIQKLYAHLFRQESLSFLQIGACLVALSMQIWALERQFCWHSSMLPTTISSESACSSRAIAKDRKNSIKRIWKRKNNNSSEERIRKSCSITSLYIGLVACCIGEFYSYRINNLYNINDSCKICYYIGYDSTLISSIGLHNTCMQISCDVCVSMSIYLFASFRWSQENPTVMSSSSNLISSNWGLIFQKFGRWSVFYLENVFFLMMSYNCAHMCPADGRVAFLSYFIDVIRLFHVFIL